MPPFICRPGKYWRLRDHLDSLLEAQGIPEDLPQDLSEASEAGRGELVRVDDDPAHLAEHDPRAFDTEEVQACFLVRP